MTQLTEKELLDSIKRGLDYSAGNLDGQTRSRLTQIRLQALEKNNRLSTVFHIPSFAHVFAAAAVVTLFVTLWVLPNVKDSLPMQVTPTVPLSEEMTSGADATELDMNAMDVLMSNEEMDFLENLEIYEWLEAEYG